MPHRIASAVITLGLLSVSGAIADEELRNPFANDAQAAQEGQALYRKAGCYPCHGLEAQGATGPDLTDDTWRYEPTDAMLFRTITKGRSGTPMPPFGTSLPSDQVWKIIEFLREKNRQRKAACSTGCEN
jgi:mono/diheme cytochrome c family protein